MRSPTHPASEPDNSLHSELGADPMSSRYEHIWWSIEIPDGWTASSVRERHILRSASGSDALRFESARAEVGVITDNELREYAGARIARGFHSAACSFGSFVGLALLPPEGSTEHACWWLRHGRLMLVVASLIELPDTTAEQILATLQPRECA